MLFSFCVCSCIDEFCDEEHISEVLELREFDMLSRYYT